MEIFPTPIYMTGESNYAKLKISTMKGAQASPRRKQKYFLAMLSIKNYFNMQPNILES